MKWKVVGTYEPPAQNILPEVKVAEKYGMKACTTSNCIRSEMLAKLFLELAFIDWKDKVTKMN